MEFYSLLKHAEKRRKIIVLLFFALLFFIGLMIFDDYGLSWDETAQRTSGIISLDYALGKNQNLLTYPARYYGTSFEMFLVSIERIAKLEDMRDIYLMRHLVTFLLFYTSVIFFYLLCKTWLRSWKLGLLGSLFLIISPRIFADSFSNSKDLALLSVFIISIYTLVFYLERKTFLRASIHALVSGILIDVRILGIIVPVFTVFFFVLDLTQQFKSQKTKISTCIFSLAIYSSLCISFTILFWPTLWDRPLHQFVQAFTQMKEYPWNGPVLYMGEYIRAAELPWHYIPVWLIITTPILYTVNFLIGLIVSVYATLKNPLDYSRNKIDLIFLSWFFCPLIAIIAFKSVLYDGWRHLFFIYPAFLLISLRGLTFLFEFFASNFRAYTRKILSTLFISIILLSLINTGHFMIKNHPHQNVYFNRLAGPNMTFVKNNFELDYWGLSYRQAYEYIVKNDPREIIKIYPENHPGDFSSYTLKPEYRKRLQYSSLHEADYFVSNYRWHREDYSYTDEFYSIQIDNAKIAVVYKLK